MPLLAGILHVCATPSLVRGSSTCTLLCRHGRRSVAMQATEVLDEETESRLDALEALATVRLVQGGVTS